MLCEKETPYGTNRKFDNKKTDFMPNMDRRMRREIISKARENIIKSINRISIKDTVVVQYKDFQLSTEEKYRKNNHQNGYRFVFYTRGDLNGKISKKLK